jgi:hypothetical protein
MYGDPVEPLPVPPACRAASQFSVILPIARMIYKMSYALRNKPAAEIP